ncbi:unnamed protein product [Urochloa humidicola]
MAANAAGGDKLWSLWRPLVAVGSLLAFGFEYGHRYLEKLAELKSKQLVLDSLKEASKNKDEQIAHLEAAWKSEVARREAEAASKAEEALKAAEAKRWFSWIHR